MRHSIRILLSLLLAMSGTASACDYQQDFDESGAALQVLRPTFTVGSGDSAPESKAVMLTVLGELKNTSKSCIENIVVEVKFFDAQNKLVDANTEPVPGVEVLPGREVAFRTVLFATRPKESYSSMTARVVAAEQNNEETETCRAGTFLVGGFYYQLEPNAAIDWHLDVLYVSNEH